jgi:myo-inositol-1(or 4)-monophosphatase
MEKAVEIIVSTELKKKFPQYKFIGSETSPPGTQVTDEPTFIVDAMDGSTNFARGLSDVCISIAFVEGKVPTVGVVYNPFRRELYTGIKGHGAYLTRDNGEKQRLPLNANPEPLGPLNTAVVVERGDDGHPNFGFKIKAINRLSEGEGGMVRSTRRIGSAALSLAAVSAGQLDVCWVGGG